MIASTSILTEKSVFTAVAAVTIQISETEQSEVSGITKKDCKKNSTLHTGAKMM
jgi:hypothetical protein